MLLSGCGVFVTVLGNWVVGPEAVLFQEVVITETVLIPGSGIVLPESVPFSWYVAVVPETILVSGSDFVIVNDVVVTWADNVSEVILGSDSEGVV